MSTTPDALSDALIAALLAVVPGDALVIDHDALPIKREDVATGGSYGVFLFEDAPEGDGTTYDQETSTRTATFKVALRVIGDPRSLHLLKATAPARALVAKAVAKDATLGGLAKDTRITTWRPLVVEANSSVAAAELDIAITYRFAPEVA